MLIAHPRPLSFFALLAAAACASLGGVPSARAATQLVSNCNDAGAGSLRAAVANAASGDTVDLRGLRCATIALTSQVEVPQADLTVLGPGLARLTIDANQAGRLFVHRGAGTLRLQGMTLARGRELAQEALGGCLRSMGNVTLESVHIHFCEAEGQRPPDDEGLGTGAMAGGGGLHVVGHVRMVDSQIHDATASTITGYGGGVAAGALTMVASRLHANHAEEGAGANVTTFNATHSLIDHNTGARGGGLNVRGDAFVLRSTIADNAAVDQCGGLCVNGHARIVDSTVARNTSRVASAAGFSGDAEIFNSTIADNRGQPGWLGCAPVITRLDTPYRLHIESSIVAGNRCSDGSAPLDVHAMTQEDVVTGADNLIGLSNGSLPADTIGGNPRLAPLADNGGPTPTMRPASDSAVIDRGGNPLGLSNDQRGSGYARAKGAGADIGAYER